LEVTERGPKETGSRREIKPGDIIQFRDAKMKGKKASGRKFVVEGSLTLDDLQTGWMRFYRAVK
jgi:hypothetical protein